MSQTSPIGANIPIYFHKVAEPKPRVSSKGVESKSVKPPAGKVAVATPEDLEVAKKELSQKEQAVERLFHAAMHLKPEERESFYQWFSKLGEGIDPGDFLQKGVAILKERVGDAQTYVLDPMDFIGGPFADYEDKAISGPATEFKTGLKAVQNPFRVVKLVLDMAEKLQTVESLIYRRIALNTMHNWLQVWDKALKKDPNNAKLKALVEKGRVEIAVEEALFKEKWVKFTAFKAAPFAFTAVKTCLQLADVLGKAAKFGFGIATYAVQIFKDVYDVHEARIKKEKHGSWIQRLKTWINARKAQKKVSDNPKVKESFLNLMRLAKQKHKIEHKFLSINLGKAATSLVGTVIGMGASVVVQVLIWVGILIAGTALAVGLAVAGGVFSAVIPFVVLGIGLGVAFHYRPNLTKRIFDRIKVAFYDIPKAFQAMRLQAKECRKYKTILEKAHLIRGHIEELKMLQIKEGFKMDVPAHLWPLVQKLQKAANGSKITQGNFSEQVDALRRTEEEKLRKQIEMYDKDIKKLQESVGYWQKKIEPLQKKIDEAKKKDFERAYDKYKKKVDLGCLRNYVTELIEDLRNVNPKALKGFDKQFGTNLVERKEELEKMWGEKKEGLQLFEDAEEKASLIDEVEKKIRKFLTMDEEDLFKFIDKQSKRLMAMKALGGTK